MDILILTGRCYIESYRMESKSFLFNIYVVDVTLSNRTRIGNKVPLGTPFHSGS